MLAVAGLSQLWELSLSKAGSVIQQQQLARVTHTFYHNNPEFLLLHICERHYICCQSPPNVSDT